MRKNLFRQIRSCIEHRERFAVATVIFRSGSGPREPGATMLIRTGGETVGTIGGGVLEAKVLKMAEDVMMKSRPACRTFFLTDQQASIGGMICGGQVEILVDYVDGNDPSWLKIIEQALTKHETGQPCWLVRSIRNSETGDKGGVAASEETIWVKTGLGFMDEDHLDPGTLDSSCLDVNVPKTGRRRAETVLIPCGNIRYVVQPAGVPRKVFIFGAGHVAKELAPLCNFIGLSTVIVDDRPEFASAARFPTADEILIPESFRNCLKITDINENSSVVIVTRGHENDRTVLAQALRTKADYIGMIGSRTKRDTIYRTLLEEGFSTEDLSRVHCPIGLDIGAQTPAEIAVSIVAELIAVGSGKTKNES